MAREYVKKDNMLSKEIRYKKTEKGMMLQNENLWHQEPFFAVQNNINYFLRMK